MLLSVYNTPARRFDRSQRRATASLATIGLILQLAATGAFAAPVAPDDVYIGKKKVRGVVAKTENGVAYVNTYNTRIPRVQHGVEQFPASKVSKIVPPRDPRATYLRKLHETCPPGGKPTADGEFKIGEIAASLKLKDVARVHFLNALALDFRHDGARAKFDKSDLERRTKADPRFNAQLHEALMKWFAIEKLSERKTTLDKIRRAHHFPHDLRYMERVRRSRTQPKGRRDDVALTLNSKTEKGVYTVFVPKNYDPLRPWPLVLGLHGGGRDGKDGKDVVGSGRSAMAFYQTGASRFGYIVVCPTAVRAPWGNKKNDAFVLSVLEEVSVLYNIDFNRVYLTGHSMGGYGTWHFGPKYCERWAVISPMAGGGHNGLNKLRKTKTPVYLYHGADDNVVGCGDSRNAADSMRKAKDDFIYAEIPDSGHGFPRDVCDEMWSFFEQRRLAATKKRTARGKFRVQLLPYSSFAEAPSKAERRYFGAPGEAPVKDKKTLLAKLRLGGGGASEAADGLIELADKSTVKPIASLLRSKKTGDDVKRQAIRVLGALGQPAGLKPLQSALRTVSLDLLPAVCEALRTLHNAVPDAGATSTKPLMKAMARVDDEFDKRRFGTRMAFSDWKRCMDGYAAVARTLGALGDAAALPAFERSVNKVLAKDWNPRKSDRARLDPKRPLGKCVVAVIKAIARIDRTNGQPIIDKLIAKHGALRGVREAAGTNATAK